MQNTLIIAEVGVNHNGDILLAKQLISEAANAGADIVKFQTFKADLLATKLADKAEYQKKNTDSCESQYSMLKRLELTVAQHKELIKHCKDNGVEFLSSAFDEESVRMLASLNQRRFKIPSGEITNLPLLRQIGKLGKPIIMSTGMSNLDEIKEAIYALEMSGANLDKLTLLHCTSQYPAPVKDLNLLAMKTISRELCVSVGYSDHSSGVHIAIAAAALGASIIEKHLTIDVNLEGPDHTASLEPDEFAKMVKGIRAINKALGDGVKRPSQSESENIISVRRSIVAAMPIKQGEIFSYKNLTSKRPATGISPMRIDEFIGKPSPRNFEKDDFIQC